SSRLNVTKVICIFASSSQVFYSVVAEVPDPLVWDWPNDRQLIWVYDNGNSVKV
ncbi:hypothetical protein LZ30DRAFT_606901, partial [Colletotrichum cereale]